MSDTPLTWTTAAPTQAGYYWLRWSPASAQIVEVKDHQDGSPLDVEFMGHEMNEPLPSVLRDQPCEWAGPITEPAG